MVTIAFLFFFAHLLRYQFEAFFSSLILILYYKMPYKSSTSNELYAQVQCMYINLVGPSAVERILCTASSQLICNFITFM